MLEDDDKGELEGEYLPMDWGKVTGIVTEPPVVTFLLKYGLLKGIVQVILSDPFYKSYHYVHRDKL